jgi:hypothetical protein
MLIEKSRLQIPYKYLVYMNINDYFYCFINSEFENLIIES